MVYLAGVSTLVVDPEKCTGCGVCVQVRARGVLAIQDRVARVIDLDACIECGACKKNCAFGAIQVKTGVGCANAVINRALGRKSACCVVDDDAGGDCDCA